MSTHQHPLYLTVRGATGDLLAPAADQGTSGIDFAISHAAYRASSAVFGAVMAAGDGFAAIARALRQRRTRRETIRTLSRIDDRLLADIGIERGRIPEVAAGLQARTEAAGTLAAPAARRGPASLHA